MYCVCGKLLPDGPYFTHTTSEQDLLYISAAHPACCIEWGYAVVTQCTCGEALGPSYYIVTLNDGTAFHVAAEHPACLERAGWRDEDGVLGHLHYTEQDTGNEAIRPSA